MARISFTYVDRRHKSPCVYDVVCLEAGQEATLFDPKPVSDPTADNHTYNALMRYECPRAMEFRVNASYVTPTLDFRCKWDGTWDRPTTLPPCVCTY